MTDKNKWNTACDITFEILKQPQSASIRAAIRDELCCNEVDQVITLLLSQLSQLRK